MATGAYILCFLRGREFCNPLNDLRRRTLLHCQVTKMLIFNHRLYLIPLVAQGVANFIYFSFYVHLETFGRGLRGFQGTNLFNKFTFLYRSTE